MRKSAALALLVLFLTAAASSPALADGCAKERPLTPAERAAVESWTAALERLLPAPPGGWKLFESKKFSSAAGTVCEDGGRSAPFWAAGCQKNGERGSAAK